MKNTLMDAMEAYRELIQHEGKVEFSGYRMEKKADEFVYLMDEEGYCMEPMGSEKTLIEGLYNNQDFFASGWYLYTYDEFIEAFSCTAGIDGETAKNNIAFHDYIFAWEMEEYYSVDIELGSGRVTIEELEIVPPEEMV